MKKTFRVTGMSCANCVANIEKAVSKVRGVTSVSVNLTEEIMIVSFDNTVTREDRIVLAVEKAGYKAFDTDYTDKDKHQKNGALIRLIVSLVLALTTLAVAMLYIGDIYVNSLMQAALALTVLILNRHFFVNAFKALRNKGTNMDVLVSLGSSCAFLFSVYAVVKIFVSLESGDGEAAGIYRSNLYFDSSAMILSLVSVGKFLESKSKKKTGDAINALLDICPKKTVRVTVGEDNKTVEEVISTQDIKKGDLIQISSGEAICADGTVVEGLAHVDESSVTGESEAILKKAGDEVTSGTMLLDKQLLIKTTAVGDDSTLMRIVRMTREAGATKAPIARLADKISSIFVPTIVMVAIITFIVWRIISPGYLSVAVRFAVSVLVISCPCALGLATPVAISVGMGIGAKRGILFKSAESLERLRGIDIAVFDKTGTITDGVVSAEGEVTGDGIRENSAEALKILKDMGIKTMMLTGDKEEKALKIAKEAGVDEVKYGLKPDDKAVIVSELMKEHKVLMVGDGINDAPALATAEVGMAMGAGKDIAIESADVILMHNDLLDVVRAVRIGRKTITNVKENLFWAFFYNACAIPIAAGVLAKFNILLNPMIGAACMSLSSICVVLNALRLKSFNPDKGMAKREDKKMISFTVEGMMCEHCKARVENALKAVNGVSFAQADLEAKTVTVEADASVSKEMLENAVTEAGYQVK